jgi:response regulator of citrate/malate metabolism
VADKKAEAEAALEAAKGKWAEASTDLPKMVGAIQSRLDILTKSKKLPKGLDKATLDQAVASFDAMKASWTEATNAATSGNFVDAMGKADAIKAKGAEVMAALGMTTG